MLALRRARAPKARALVWLAGLFSRIVSRETRLGELIMGRPSVEVSRETELRSSSPKPFVCPISGRFACPGQRFLAWELAPLLCP